MQVILRQDVEKVGLRGEVVDVAAGFARNYLLPRRLAEPAVPGRVAELEKFSASRAQHEAQSFEQAQELAQKLEGRELRFDVQAGETGVAAEAATEAAVAEAEAEEQPSDEPVAVDEPGEPAVEAPAEARAETDQS